MSTRFNPSNNYLRFGLPDSIRKISACPCGVSLETGAKVIAIIQMVMSGFLLLVSFVVFVLLLVISSRHDKKDDLSMEEYLIERLGQKAALLVTVLGIGLFVATFCLHFYLYRGIKQKSYAKVNLWWKIVLVVNLIVFVQNVVTSISRGEGQWGGLELIVLCFDVYSLWLVYEYKTELARASDPIVEFERVL